MSKVMVMDHPLIQHKIGIMRDKNTSTKEFRALVAEVAQLVYYEASRNLELSDKVIETPLVKTTVKEIAGKKILIGWSAAVFVFGPTLALVNRYSPEMNIYKLENLQALSLTDIEVLPHYSKFLKKIPHFEEICREYEEAHCKQVLRLNDGDGILIDSNDVVSCYA